MVVFCPFIICIICSWICICIILSSCRLACWFSSRKRKLSWLLLNLAQAACWNFKLLCSPTFLFFWGTYGYGKVQISSSPLSLSFAAVLVVAGLELGSDVCPGWADSLLNIWEELSKPFPMPLLLNEIYVTRGCLSGKGYFFADCNQGFEFGSCLGNSEVTSLTSFLTSSWKATYNLDVNCSIFCVLVIPEYDFLCEIFVFANNINEIIRYLFMPHWLATRSFPFPTQFGLRPNHFQMQWQFDSSGQTKLKRQTFISQAFYKNRMNMTPVRHGT